MSDTGLSTPTPANDGVAIDEDSLIALVGSRPVIYDVTMRDHHNADVIKKCWQEIGKEMNLPGNACKAKWINLRSSYNRYMRESKITPSESGQKKKRWYLADAMSFLQLYSTPRRTLTSYLSSTHASPVLNAIEGCTSMIKSEDIHITDTDMTQCELDTTLPVVNNEQNCNVVPKEIRIKSAAELVTAPIMTQFLACDQWSKMNQEQEKKEDPMLTFFRSLLPETSLLDVRRKRQFKSQVQSMINNMLDEQEFEKIQNSRPSSTGSCGIYSLTQ